MKPGPARRITIVCLAGLLVIVAAYLETERPWVSEAARLDRCVDLRYERDQVLVRHDRETSAYSRDEIRAFCKVDAANDNLNSKGGVKRVE